MSAWTNGTYTRKGLALLAKLTQGTSLRITRAEAGTGYVSDSVLANQTAVTGAKQELTFRAASYPDAGTCKLPMYLTNKGLAAGYKARQIGLYANDPDEGEILYFIAQSQNGTDVPSAADMPDYSATWTFYFKYGQADEVSVTVDPSNAITVDMLEEVRAIAEEGISVSVSGAAVRYDNAAVLPLAGLKLFGKTTQDGVPTPDAPVELESIEGADIRVYGKNLLPIGTATFEVTKSYDVAIPAGEYWLSCHIESTDTDGDNSTIVFLKNGQNVLYLPMKRGAVSRKLTLKDDVDRVQLCAAYNNTQGVGDTATWSNVQLERSDRFTGYEAYKQPQRISGRELSGIPVNSGGNYTDAAGQQWICDEVDFARGLYVQRVGKVEFDGSEAWGYGSFTTDENKTYVYLTDTTVENVHLSICTHAKFSTDTAQWKDGKYMKSGGGRWQTMTDMSVQEWSEYLAEQNYINRTPVTVYYPLTTPVEHALYDTELAAYAALTANNPVTTVTNDAGAWMEVDFIKAQHETAVKMISAGRAVESAECPGCYYRIVDGRQEWLNPPMQDQVLYLTTERMCGEPVAVYTFFIPSLAPDETVYEQVSDVANTVISVAGASASLSVKASEEVAGMVGVTNNGSETLNDLYVTVKLLLSAGGGGGGGAG